MMSLCQKDVKIATELNMTVISECGTKILKERKKEEKKEKFCISYSNMRNLFNKE